MKEYKMEKSEEKQALKILSIKKSGFIVKFTEK